MNDLMANISLENSPWRRKRKFNVPDNFVINIKTKKLKMLKSEVGI
jgi:hypothetical protein